MKSYTDFFGIVFIYVVMLWAVLTNTYLLGFNHLNPEQGLIGSGFSDKNERWQHTKTQLCSSRSFTMYEELMLPRSRDSFSNDKVNSYSRSCKLS